MLKNIDTNLQNHGLIQTEPIKEIIEIIANIKCQNTISNAEYLTMHLQKEGWKSFLVKRKRI